MANHNRLLITEGLSWNTANTKYRNSKFLSRKSNTVLEWKIQKKNKKDRVTCTLLNVIFFSWRNSVRFIFFQNCRRFIKHHIVTFQAVAGSFNLARADRVLPGLAKRTPFIRPMGGVTIHQVYEVLQFVCQALRHTHVGKSMCDRGFEPGTFRFRASACFKRKEPPIRFRQLQIWNFCS